MEMGWLCYSVLMKFKTRERGNKEANKIKDNSTLNVPFAYNTLIGTLVHCLHDLQGVLKQAEQIKSSRTKAEHN